MKRSTIVSRMIGNCESTRAASAAPIATSVSCETVHAADAMVTPVTRSKPQERMSFGKGVWVSLVGSTWVHLEAEGAARQGRRGYAAAERFLENRADWSECTEHVSDFSERTD
jgi:hypothetical protein